MARFTVIIICL